MASAKVRLTFPENLIKEPLIYTLGRDFNLITNIRQANVDEHVGWVSLELEGDQQEIQNGLEWISTKGVRVDLASGDVIDG
jgi:ABC-type methionine transport system ATPase subunit